MSDPLNRAYAVTTILLALLLGLVAAAWEPHYKPVWDWVTVKVTAERDR